MRRVMLATVLIAGLTISWSAAQGAPEKQVAQGARTQRAKVCHRTSSARRPYRLVTVRTRAALRAHTRHAQDIVPAPAGGCPRTVLSPTAGGQQLRAFMLGALERPDAGDRDGHGEATFRLQRGLGRVCFVLNVHNITLPSAGSHIHVGAAGVAGGIVVQLVAPGASGTSRGCAAASRALVGRILGNPAGFYANVHTTDFPGGAIRGQLETVAGGTTVLVAAMTGDQERRASDPVTPAGDPDGLGASVVRFTGTQVCFSIAVRNIVLPSVGAHIHRGAATVVGPIVVPFTAPDASGSSSACVTADAALVQEILANPAGFYTNVHTTDFPGGAVRGQLTAP
jgi:hypothetical protein